MNMIKDRRGLIFAVMLAATGFGLLSASTDANAYYRGYYHNGYYHGYGYHNYYYNRGWNGWGIVIAPGVGYYGPHCGWVAAHRNINGRWIPAHQACW